MCQFVDSQWARPIVTLDHQNIEPSSPQLFEPTEDSGFRQIKIGHFKLDTNWVHIVQIVIFFQSRVQKNAHHHKGCDWLTSRKYYGNTSTKKLSLIIIGFDTPTNNDGDEDNDILAIASLASDARDTGKGGVLGLGDRHCHLPRAVVMEPLLPPPLAMAPRTSSPSPALSPPPPPTMLPKSVAQFF